MQLKVVNSEFAFNLFISIKKFAFEFNIVTVNMSSSNAPPSIEKKEGNCFKKTF